MECPFCEIVQGKAKAEGLYRDDEAGWVAFAPLNPVTGGHYLVVPYEHRTLMTLDPWSLFSLMDGVREIAERLQSLVSESFNVIQSNGTAATQTVEHVHFHIVPRRENDGLALPWTGQEAKA